MNIKRKTIRAGANSTDIISAYQKAFNMSWWQSLLAMFQGVFKMADQAYNEADEGVIMEILAKDKTDLEKYKAEDFDCDDFAFRLMGVFHQDLRTAAMPIFITWVSFEISGNIFQRIWRRIKAFVTGDIVGHALLSYYKDSKVKIIEPQNDDVYAVPQKWSLLLLCG